ncbi:MAG: antibiotic biosynthesis monooxygenase [Bacteroidota bacterium]
MITVFAEHFLNDAGQGYFADWVRDMEQELRFFDGFVMIEHMRDLKDPRRSLYFLQFESVEYLKQWTQSRLMIGFHRKIQDYELKDHHTQVLCSANADEFKGF